MVKKEGMHSSSSIVCFSCIRKSFDTCMEEVTKQDATHYRFKRFATDWECKQSVYTFKTVEGFLKHHEEKHDSEDQTIRLVCMNCLSFFEEPGLAVQHLKRNTLSVTATQAKVTKLTPKPKAFDDLFERLDSSKRSEETFVYYCSQCPNQSFDTEEALIQHASIKHNVEFYNFEGIVVDFSDCRKLSITTIHKKEERFPFWSWTGTHFTPIAKWGLSNGAMKPGCNYIPKWPYEVLYGCGICNFTNVYKNRVEKHLKFKHSIINPHDKVSKQVIEECRSKNNQKSSKSKNKGSKNDKKDGSISGEEEELNSNSESGGKSDEVFHSHRDLYKSGKRRFYCSRLFECKECCKRFDSKPAAFQHSDKCHSVYDYDVLDFRYRLEDFCCSFCDARFALTHSKTQHEKKSHKELFEQGQLC